MHRKIIKQIKMKIVWLVPVVIPPLLLIEDLDTKSLITIITAIISFAYFVQKQSMEDDKLELEAFSSFNSRYFKLASKIELIQNYWNKTVRNKVNYGLTLKEVEKYLK